MNRLNKQQKDKVTQFRAITGASDKQAMECLRSAGWSVEGGIEVFYASGMQGATSTADTRAIEQLFTHYKDPQQEAILADGIARLCEDISVDPSDVVMLVLSYHMGADMMCEFSKDEWVTGLRKLGVDSVEKLRTKLPELRHQLQDTERFRDVYNYAFSWAREQKASKGVVLPLDTALAMWQLLFADERRWQYIDDWCAFLQEHHNRAVSKDTWVQLFDFARQIKPDFSNFDESGAWPYLVDEFVDHMKQKSGMQVD